MQFIKSFKFLFVLAAFGLCITSCSKDDSVSTEEKEVDVVTTTTFKVGTRSITTDAFAIYCNQNGKEQLTIANREAILDTILDPFAMEVGDFAFTQFVDPARASYVIGTAVFGESITGVPGIRVINMVDIDYEIVSNDGTTVEGEMSGDFLIMDENGDFELLPYSVEFKALIVGVSPYCE